MKYFGGMFMMLASSFYALAHDCQQEASRNMAELYKEWCSLVQNPSTTSADKTEEFYIAKDRLLQEIVNYLTLEQKKLQDRPALFDEISTQLTRVKYLRQNNWMEYLRYTQRLDSIKLQSLPPK